MLNVLLHGDGVELLLDIFEDPELLAVVMFADFFGDDGGDGEDALASFSKGFKKSAVFVFGDDVRPDSVAVEPAIKGFPEGGVVGGEEKGSVIEALGEVL